MIGPDRSRRAAPRTRPAASVSTRSASPRASRSPWKGGQELWAWSRSPGLLGLVSMVQAPSVSITQRDQEAAASVATKTSEALEHSWLCGRSRAAACRVCRTLQQPDVAATATQPHSPPVPPPLSTMPCGCAAGASERVGPRSAAAARGIQSEHLGINQQQNRRAHRRAKGPRLPPMDAPCGGAAASDDVEQQTGRARARPGVHGPDLPEWRGGVRLVRIVVAERRGAAGLPLGVQLQSSVAFRCRSAARPRRRCRCPGDEVGRSSGSCQVTRSARGRHAVSAPVGAR